MKKMIFLVVLLLTIGMQQAFAQTTVNGTVKDSNGDAVPGASVRVKGFSDVGTITDLNGNYSLSIPSNAEFLIFSFVGLKTTEVEVSGKTIVDVVLENEDVGVDEVIVVAYGTTTKEAFTGSAEVIGAEELESRALTSTLGAIEGTTAGVQVISASGQPGESPKLVIRGVGTLNGDIDPLYIVDGVQYEGDIANINTEDIASITILKDAASTALYGSRAANGVVMITTKSSKNTRGVRVSASANIGIVSMGVPFYDKASPSQYYELMWEAYKNSLIDGGMPEEEAINEASNSIYNRLGYNPFNIPNDQIIGTDGKINSNARVIAKSLDWYDELRQAGSRKNYSVQLSAGGEDYNVYFSTAYLEEEGYIITSGYDRFNSRLNANYTPTKWLSLGGNINFSMTKKEGPFSAGYSSISNPFGFAKNIGSIYPVYIVDPVTGDFILDAFGKKQYDFGEGYSDYGIAPRIHNPARHAIAEARWNSDERMTNNIGARYYASFSILPELKFTINYGIDVNDYFSKRYENERVGDGAPQGRYRETRYRRTVWNFNQLLTYTKSFGGHNIDLTLGHENFDKDYSQVFGMKNTQTAVGISEFDNFATTSSLEGATFEKKTEGYFARLNYNFNDRYYITGSVRRDGSSVFNKDVRWGTFYSVGASWRISQENFMQGLTYINNLKLRASYGQVGQDRLLDDDGDEDFYISQPRYSLLTNAGEPGIYWSDLGNDKLTWETSSSWDVSLEFAVFDNLFEGSVEYWERNSANLLYNVPLPLSVGLSVGPDNIATIVNSGFEVNLTANIIRQNDLRWSLSASLSTQKNEITDLPDPFVAGSKRWEIGRSRYDFFTYHYAGVDPDNGDALYYMFEENVNEEGNVTFDPVLDIDGTHMTTNDYQEAGKAFAEKSAVPDLFGGFQTNLYYKGFELSILCSYSVGGYVLDYGYASMMTEGEYGESLHPDLLKGWRAPGDIVDIPRMEYGAINLNQTLSTRYLTSRSYFALRNINLSYTFQQQFIKDIGIENLRLYLVAENLFLKTARKGLNPQYNLAGTPSGNDFNPSRVISVGLNISF